MTSRALGESRLRLAQRFFAQEMPTALRGILGGDVRLSFFAWRIGTCHLSQPAAMGSVNLTYETHQRASSTMGGYYSTATCRYRLVMLTFECPAASRISTTTQVLLRQRHTMLIDYETDCLPSMSCYANGWCIRYAYLELVGGD